MTDRENICLRCIHYPVCYAADDETSACNQYIPNGVTFATDKNDGCKWIPVSERLPEPPKECE